MSKEENLKNDHYGLYYGDARYEKVWEQMKLLGIQDITTMRQHKNGTIVWKLPIKDQYTGILIEVASFASGYVRNQGKSTHTNFQLNKRTPREEYYKLSNGDYRKFITRTCELIPIEIDRLEYLISYCLKNYYIKSANSVAEGRFVPKWKLENAQNGMVPKWKYDEAIDLGRTNAEAEALNEWQNKQDVATRARELDLQNKLDKIKRIVDYE